MTLEVVIMLLAAALLHASWHAMIKQSGDRLAGLAGMNLVSTATALLLLPFVAVPAIDIWPVLAISTLLHNVYKIGLSQVYRHGDLSLAYPIARGLSPLFATVIAFAFLGESPGMGQMSGIGLISLGLIGMSLESRGRTVDARLLTPATLTGLMVAAYSVVDAYGTRTSGDWLAFSVWLMALDGAVFVVTIRIVRGTALWRTIVCDWQRTVASGFLGVAAFAVFLWALSRGAVGSVSALRETSVLFATLIGMVALKEPRSLRRLAGATLITAGVVAFATSA